MFRQNGRHPVGSPGGKLKRTEIEMPIIDTWSEYRQTKAMPSVDLSWAGSYANQLDYDNTPRYCKACGRKLSGYNKTNYCLNGDCAPRASRPKPPRNIVLNLTKHCQMCGDEIVRGKYCTVCHNMFAARRRIWKKTHPNIVPPDAWVYRDRGSHIRMEDCL